MTQRHFFSTLHPPFLIIFANVTVVAFLLLRKSRFNFHCYTQRETTPTHKLAWKWCCNPMQLLARKITKGIHSCKPASLNRPIHAYICVSAKNILPCWPSCHLFSGFVLLIDISSLLCASGTELSKSHVCDLSNQHKYMVLVRLLLFIWCWESKIYKKYIRNGFWSENGQSLRPSFFFHGVLQPHKPYGLLGMGEEWDKAWEPRPTSLCTQRLRHPLVSSWRWAVFSSLGVCSITVTHLSLGKWCNSLCNAVPVGFWAKQSMKNEDGWFLSKIEFDSIRIDCIHDVHFMMPATKNSWCTLLIVNHVIQTNSVTVTCNPT